MVRVILCLENSFLRSFEVREKSYIKITLVFKSHSFRASSSLYKYAKHKILPHYYRENEAWCNECCSVTRTKEDVRSDKPENIFSSWYTQRERGISLCEARFQRAWCSKVVAIAVLVGLSEKDSDLRAHKTIAVLQHKCETKLPSAFTF